MSTPLSREVTRIKRQLTIAAKDLESLEAMLAEQRSNPAQGAEQEFLFEPDLAELFDRSVVTIQKWRKEGRLDPFYKKGRKIYWLKSDLPKIMKAGSTAVAETA
jgi:hypothetical protein